MNLKNFIRSDLFQQILSRKWLPYFILAFIIFLTYFKSLSFTFSPLDDTQLIVKKIDWMLHISNFPKIFLKGIFLDANAHAPDYYRPFLIASFMLDTLIGKGNPFVYHLTNILLHMIATILFFIVFSRITDNKRIAFIFSLIFAVHPVFAQAIAWIPGRNDTLLAVFCLGSVICYFNYFSTQKMIWIFLHIIFYIFSFFSKESAIVLPVLLFLWTFINFKKTRNKELILFSLLWGIIILGSLYFESKIVYSQNFLGKLNFYNLITNSFKPFVIYFGKIFIPVFQSVIPYVPDTPYIPGLIIFIFFIFILIKYKFYNNGLALIGISWFVFFLVLPLLILTMLSNSVEHYEHRLYLPVMGIMILLSQIKIKIPHQTFIVLIILTLFFIKTINRLNVYQNSITFSQAAVAESPTSSHSHSMLGYEYYYSGNFKEAVKELDRARELDSLGNEFKANTFVNRSKTIHPYKVK